MVNQFKFSEGKLKNNFNAAVNTYISKLRQANNNPTTDDAARQRVQDYFDQYEEKVEQNKHKRMKFMDKNRDKN